MTRATYLTVRNQTSFKMDITVSGVDSYDWDGHSRPDENFNNVTIDSFAELTNREEINSSSQGCWYTLHIVIGNGDVIEIRNDQLDALDSMDREYVRSQGYLVWQICGKNYNKFIITPERSNWMQDSLSLLRNRNLRHLCIPGSHDAGMSKRINSGDATLPAPVTTVVTQQYSIAAQLDLGVRFFDLRVFKRHSAFQTGHFTNKELNFGSVKFSIAAGCLGESMSDILDSVQTFCTKNHKELVILQFTKCDNLDDWDDKENKYPPLTDVEFADCLTQASQKMSSCLYECTTSTNITSVTVGELIADKSTVLLISKSLRDGLPKGAYPLVDEKDEKDMKQPYFSMYDQWADKNEAQAMIDDQVAKLQAKKVTADSTLFLMSWQLTQSLDDVFACLSSLDKDDPRAIRQLAATVNPRITEIKDHCTADSFPNIVQLDFIHRDVHFMEVVDHINKNVVKD